MNDSSEILQFDEARGKFVKIFGETMIREAESSVLERYIVRVWSGMNRIEIKEA